MSFGLPHDKTKLTYGGYLKVEELLQLQQLQSDPPRHDEMLFIVIHQVYELWFRQLLHELDDVLRRLDGGDVLGATRLVRRCLEIQRVLVAQISVLETMTPTDFLSFRDHLMPASGFQSAQFREIEFLTGMKDDRFLSYYPEDSPSRAQLKLRYDGRTLHEAMLDVLGARGFAADASGVATLYRDPAAHYDLFLLLEGLIELDEMFTLWRLRHIQMVERVIGGRPGTGGSSGAGYLRTTVERRIFPELWEARNLIERSPDS